MNKSFFCWSLGIASNILKDKCTHHGLFEFIGFDTAHKKGLTDAQRPHEQLQRSFKLTAESRGTFSGLHSLKTQKLFYYLHTEM